jgi:tetratricopeptide (TPR) repeat protein
MSAAGGNSPAAGYLFVIEVLMSSRIPRALFIVLACLAFTAPAFAQGGGGPGRGDDQAAQAAQKWRGKAELSGKITDEAGKPVEARVSFVNVEVNAGFSVMSKKNGEFKAENMKSGDWKIQVDAPNFIVWKQNVTLGDQKNPPLAVVIKRDNSPELLTKADALFKEGKNAEARAEYMKVLEAHPDLAGINRAIAYTYGKEGNHPEALKYLDLAIAKNPDDATLLQLAGASAISVSDYPRAMGYLDKIDDAALADPGPLVNAAINMITKHQPANAVKLLDRAINRFPDNPEAYFYRGFARLQLDTTDTAAAKADLEKFVATAPPNAQELAQAKDLLSKIK